MDGAKDEFWLREPGNDGAFYCEKCFPGSVFIFMEQTKQLKIQVYEEHNEQL